MALRCSEQTQLTVWVKPPIKTTKHSAFLRKHPALYSSILVKKTLYISGDTVWYEGVKDAIAKHQPEVIVLNAALAAFPDETPILMGTDGLYEYRRLRPPP